MEAKFHYSRIRKRGEPDWLDPQTDIRKIIPQVMIDTFDNLETRFEGKPEEAYFLQLHNYLRIFQIRILEDPTQLGAQLKEFFDAVNRVPVAIQHEWFRQAVYTLLSVYALFCRRDAATDDQSLHAMLEHTRLTALKNLLSPELYKEVRLELQSQVPLLVTSRTDDSAMVVCHETGEVLDNIKQIASRYVVCEGVNDWNGLAAACDRVFSTRSIKSENDAISVALAYPTYDYPTLTVEVTKNNDISGEATTPTQGVAGDVPLGDDNTPEDSQELHKAQ